MAPSGADTSRKCSFLLRKTSSITTLKFSGDVDFFLLSIEGTSLIRIRPYPRLLERNIVGQFISLCFYIVTKRKVFLSLKLWFKTLIHSDLSQATDWNHMYASIIIYFFIFQIKHNCIRIRESKGLELQNKICFCGGKSKCVFS